MLNLLKQEYLEKKNKFPEILDEIQKQITQSVQTKGYLQNIFPFEWELSGKGKLKGEEIESIPLKTMSDNYFRISYNNKKQIVMSEQWSFGSFRYLTMCFYRDDEIKCLKWGLPISDNNYSLESISLLKLDNGKALKGYNYSPISSLVSDYTYQDSLLIELTNKTSTSKETYVFEYDSNNLLSRILRTFSSEKSIQQIYPKVKWIDR